MRRASLISQVGQRWHWIICFD